MHKNFLHSHVHLVLGCLLSSFVIGCGGISGSFSGKSAGTPTSANKVQVAQSKAAVTHLTYSELGVARGRAPTAQQATDQAKIQCARTGGGNLLIMNTPPFISGGSWRVDATCAHRKSSAKKTTNTAARQPR